MWLSSSSSSSSSSAPISEHSRLHKLTPLWTILRTHPQCVETKVIGPKVELSCTEPCPPWSTCPASPIRWRTIDGCSKNARVVLWWVGSRKMSKQTKSSLCDNCAIVTRYYSLMPPVTQTELEWYWLEAELHHSAGFLWPLGCIQQQHSSTQHGGRLIRINLYPGAT